MPLLGTRTCIFLRAFVIHISQELLFSLSVFNNIQIEISGRSHKKSESSTCQRTILRVRNERWRRWGRYSSIDTGMNERMQVCLGFASSTPAGVLNETGRRIRGQSGARIWIRIGREARICAFVPSWSMNAFWGERVRAILFFLIVFLWKDPTKFYRGWRVTPWVDRTKASGASCVASFLRYLSRLCTLLTFDFFFFFFFFRLTSCILSTSRISY